MLNRRDRLTFVPIVTGFVVLGLLATSGCATGDGASGDDTKTSVSDGAADAPNTPDPAFRHAAPRRRETIFSPLELPPGNRERLASGMPGPDYWQQRADYVIEASLDETARTVSGRAEITYRNDSPTELPFLWLHLEQNLFRLDSIGAQIRSAGTRFGNSSEFDGGIDVTSVRSGRRKLEMQVYDTLARIDLPSPVAAKGGTFTFEVSWTFKIPPNGSDRMGFEEDGQGTVFQIAQWFPAIVAYDSIHGWNTLPYLGEGEFYTDFGTYDVKLTVPHAHVVAATGALQNPEEVLTPVQIERLAAAVQSKETVTIIGAADVGQPTTRPTGTSPLTWHFHAENVRTFAFASSKAFLWDAAGANGVLCQSLYPKEGLPLWAGATDMLRFSVEHYSETWFPYPYPVASNVNGTVGGMEYPMVIFCEERKDETDLYELITHEIGHNWFPMTVNSDERRHAWMDEGFNTFINWYSLQARYPKREFATRFRGFRPRPSSPEFSAWCTQTNRQSMDTIPDQIEDEQLGSLVYDKVSVGLVCLRERILDPVRFDRAFHDYVHAWAFKSPQPADFFRCMENGAGVDLSWFWRGWFLETGFLDQAITAVTPLPAGEKSRPSEAVEITFENRGELVMPLTYQVNFDDGTDDVRSLPVEIWFHSNRYVLRFPTAGKTVRSVVVDPDNGFPDVDLTNNVWAATP